MYEARPDLFASRKIKNTKSLENRFLAPKRRWKNGSGRYFVHRSVLDCPVGLGIFFAGLGYLIKCVGKVAQKDREYKDSKGWPQTDFSRVLPFFSK